MSEKKPNSKGKLPMPAAEGGFPNDPRPDGHYWDVEGDIPLLVTVREGSVILRKYSQQQPDGSDRL